MRNRINLYSLMMIGHLQRMKPERGFHLEAFFTLDAL